ncbi:hypothetical protein [Burkholderia diffusa]|uniref:hypothetical protein n=1 Tax=Burkholderia diffusa TaxID=488732 RepID=UPI00158D970E|nr:hypothetical protein [Burkholderia diffusa]
MQWNYHHDAAFNEASLPFLPCDKRRDSIAFLMRGYVPALSPKQPAARKAGYRTFHPSTA